MDAVEPLGVALEGGGRLGAAFAAYLSSRVDLLTRTEALELARLSGRSIATPYDLVCERFAEDSGRDIEEVFDSVEPEPLDVGPLFQWHRARLVGGVPVVLKVAHIELGGRLDADLERLSGILPAPRRPKTAEGDDVLRDFKDALLGALDLTREAEHLIELRRECERMSLVTIAEVHSELSGPSFLTVSDPGGITVAQRATLAASSPEDAPQRLARRLCRAWLRIVLSASKVPVDPRGRNALFLADGKIAFCGGPFETLSGRLRDQLRSYLVATAIEDHEALVDALLELGRSGSIDDEDLLRHRLRHSAPFRDGGWSADSDSLARAVLAHWHQASRLGFRPRPALLAFLRGLAHLDRAASVLAPGANAVREAFQELRLYQLFEESTRLASGDEAAPLTDLPRKLDRGLTLAAGDRLPRGQATPRASANGSWSVVLALLMAIAAVVVLVHQAVPPGDGTSWIERVGALVVLGLGGVLLRSAASE